MKIKVPKKIKIGSLVGDVKYKPYLRGDDGWKASYNQRTNALEIDTQLRGSASGDRSFLHEVVHMIDIDKECGLSEDNISRVANGVWEFLNRNLNIEFDWSEIKEE